jgi:hypothetical protein
MRRSVCVFHLRNHSRNLDEIWYWESTLILQASLTFLVRTDQLERALYMKCALNFDDVLGCDAVWTRR